MLLRRCRCCCCCAQGAITPVELYMFFKEIHHMWVHNLNEYAELNIYDVVRTHGCTWSMGGTQRAQLRCSCSPGWACRCIGCTLCVVNVLGCMKGDVSVVWQRLIGRAGGWRWRWAPAPAPAPALQVDEILDMIKPKVQARITAEDLAASGQSGIFFSVLADVKQFWEYNYRENLINHDEDQ